MKVKSKVKSKCKLITHKHEADAAKNHAYEAGDMAPHVVPQGAEQVGACDGNAVK